MMAARSDRRGSAPRRRWVPPPRLAILVALAVATASGVYASAEGQRMPAIQPDRAAGTLLAAARVEIPAADVTSIRMVTWRLAPLAVLVGEAQPGPLLFLVATGELAVRRDDGNVQRVTLLGAGDQLALPAGTAVHVSGNGDQPVTFSVVALRSAARDATWGTMDLLTAGQFAWAPAVAGESARSVRHRSWTQTEDE